jgi:uncharacterized protein YkwD
MITRRGALGALSAAATLSRTEEHDFARRVFSRINDLRELHGSAALQWSAAVASCARDQSLRKAELRFAGHTDPERGDVAARLRNAGIGWGRCGENLFMEKGWEDPVNFAVVFWWYSAGHKENLLNPQYTQSGVGLAQGLDRTWFVTQIFIVPVAGSMGMGR